jgi:hypothetical protein
MTPTAGGRPATAGKEHEVTTGQRPGNPSPVAGQDEQTLRMIEQAFSS